MASPVPAVGGIGPMGGVDALAQGRSSTTRVTWVIAGGVVLAVGAGAVALQLPDFAHFSAPAVLLVCLGSVGFAVAAIILALEPAQRPNARLFAAASVLFAMEWAFTWPHTPLPFLGLPLGQLFAVCLGVVLLRYPHARMQRTSERWFVVASVAFTVVARGLWAVTTEPQWFAFGIADGHGHLPASTWWLVIDADRRASHAIAVATDVGQLLVVPLFLVLIVRRVRRESRLARAELLPVVVGTFVLGAVLITHLVAALVSSYAPAAAPNEWISAVLSLAVVLVPVAFVVAGARRRLARAAVAELVVSLSRAPSSAGIEAALRTTLRDDTLELLYRLPESGEFVDVRGRPCAGGPDVAHPVVVPVLDRAGKLLAVVRTGADQGRHLSLLNSAVAASSLAIENSRLEAQLRAQLQDVRESRDRVVAATLAERRRLERDLHDGVQQQLLAIGASVGLLALQQRSTGSDDALINDIRDQLRRTRREVRLLARGLHPTVLSEDGLAAALVEMARRLPLEVDLDVQPGRWPPDAELTAYFVVGEALTNCVSHAGSTHAAVTVRSADGVLSVQVADDGRGGARFTAGGGLSGLRDRVRSLGGDLELRDIDGHGTVLRMHLPFE